MDDFEEKYLHVKNLEKYHPGYKKEIYSEAHLEKFILMNWGEIFDFPYYATRIKISRRSIVDLIGKDSKTIYLIELKHRPIRRIDLKQIRRYKRDSKIMFPSLRIKMFLIDYNHYSMRVNIYAL